MGICLELRSVSDDNILKILESPPLVWLLLMPNDPDIYFERVNEKRRGNFLTRLFGGKEADPITHLPDLGFGEGENEDEYLDKSWHGIHYCLNRTDWHAEPPMDFLTAGGTKVGDGDLGYGQPRLFDSRTVKQIDEKIFKITAEALRQNYDAAEMEKLNIYPPIWESGEDDSFEYLAGYFEMLQSFVASCAKRTLGMAVCFC